jgi:hypothetical protein
MILHGKKWMAIGFAVLITAIGMAGASWAQGIDPSSVEETIADGASVQIQKTVHTPAIPPDADICFLADTTGSMGPALANVQAGIGGIMTNVLAESPDAHFCAAQYRDTDEASGFTFQLDQALTGNTAAVQAAVSGWSTGPGIGGDALEDQLHALTVMAGATPGWRAAPAAHILVWFGDCGGHDPASGGENLAGTINALASSGAGAPVIVLAVSVASAASDCPPGYLDEPVNGHAQATEITAGTGGVLFSAVDEDAVSDAIAAALAQVEIPIAVAMVSDCSTATSGVVSTSFVPASQVVNAGEDAIFTETISVSATPAQQGLVYECDDWATIDGTPMTDADRNTIFEHKTITVPDTTAPVTACRQTTNPSDGQNVPPAGSGTGNSGQNPDGFYVLLATDNVDPDPDIFVVDKGTDGTFGTADDTQFGPFASGTKIKYVEANGATPTQMPGTGDIDWIITGRGDFGVYAVDASGNVGDHVQCHVPPPPR